MADDDALTGSAGGAIVKSERKRKRERQRRSDLASAFEELATLVAQIDPEEGDEGGDNNRSGKRGRRKSDDPPDVDSMTRLDLIGRTTGVLRRLQRENAELRRRVDEKGRTDDSVRCLESSGLPVALNHVVLNLLPCSFKTQEVLVMVPTLTPVHPQQPAVPLPPEPHYPARHPVAYNNPPNYYVPHHQHAAMMDPTYGAGGGVGGGYYPPPPQHGGGSYAPPSAPASYGNWGDASGGGYAPSYPSTTAPSYPPDPHHHNVDSPGQHRRHDV
jgi:Helix-loop-helix DNA-binding domain